MDGTAVRGGMDAALLRRPLAGVLLLFLACVVTARAGVRVAQLVQEWPLAMILVFLVATAAVPVALLLSWGWWERAGFTKPSQWRSLHLLWLPILLVLLVASAGLDTSGLDEKWPDIVTSVWTGFYEEAVFRGLLLTFLLVAWGSRRQGVLAAVLVTTVLFGLVHVVNLLFGAGLVDTAVQVATATFIGLMYAAVRLRTHTLWPLVVVHAVIDVVGVSLAPASSDGEGGISWVYLGFTALCGLYGLFLIRPNRFVLDQRSMGLERR